MSVKRAAERLRRDSHLQALMPIRDDLTTLIDAYEALDTAARGMLNAYRLFNFPHQWQYALRDPSDLLEDTLRANDGIEEKPQLPADLVLVCKKCGDTGTDPDMALRNCRWRNERGVTVDGFHQPLVRKRGTQ